MCVCPYRCMAICIFLSFLEKVHAISWLKSNSETVAMQWWVAILHVVMRLIGPSPICSGSLSGPRLLKLTIILPNLACVTAEDKCVMPSPRAARKILSRFKCQTMLFNNPQRFNMDRGLKKYGLVLHEYECMQIQKNWLYRTNQELYKLK